MSSTLKPKSRVRPGAPEPPKHVHEDLAGADVGPVDETSAPRPERVLHVNGRPLPAGFEHAIPYAATDEGIAEANETRAEPSGISVTGDAWDKTLARGADPATSREVWEDINPLTTAVERATGGKPDGFAYRLLSNRVIQKKGMRRFEPAVDLQTKHEIRVGDMFLGRMPEELRARRNAHYQALGNEQLAQVETAYATNQDSAIHAAGSEGVSTLRRGDALHDHRDPDRSIESIGVRATHGLKGQTAA